jgi:hypothetical protein
VADEHPCIASGVGRGEGILFGFAPRQTGLMCGKPLSIPVCRHSAQTSSKDIPGRGPPNETALPGSCMRQVQAWERCEFHTKDIAGERDVRLRQSSSESRAVGDPPQPVEVHALPPANG